MPENDYLVTYFFGNPAGRAWWDLLDKYADAEFHAAVDAAIQRTAAPQGQHWEPKAWQARIQARLEESAKGP